MTKEDHLSNLKSTRDSLLCGLWTIYRQMFDIIGQDDFEQDDVDVWYWLTKHRAIQKKLDTTKDK